MFVKRVNNKFFVKSGNATNISLGYVQTYHHAKFDIYHIYSVQEDCNL